VETTHQGVETTHQGVETTHQGVETTHQGVETTHQGVETTHQGVETTPLRSSAPLPGEFGLCGLVTAFARLTLSLARCRVGLLLLFAAMLL